MCPSSVTHLKPEAVVKRKEKESIIINRGNSTIFLYSNVIGIYSVIQYDVLFRYRKSFPQLAEDDKHNQPDPPNYSSAEAPPSVFPERHFCAVCGYFSNYTCVCCGTRYCSVKCLNVHTDTRCQKWTA